MSCLRGPLVALLLGMGVPAQTLQAPEAADSTKIRFLVAGHAYGAHSGSNQGLHPPLLEKLAARSFGHLDFLAFTGDVLRRCNEDSWKLLEDQLRPLGIPFYLALGNHDASKFGLARVKQQFGSLYYSFDIASARFIFLDTQEVSRTISPAQIAFLRNAVENSQDIEVFFVFMHELLWLSEKPEYRKIRANSRSRQKKLGKSNYWSEVHPLLVGLAPRQAFVFAGDVAGNEDAIPAFRDQVQNVALIASGMGEVKEENALLVTVQGGKPTFRLFALDGSGGDAAVPRSLDDYTPAKLNALPWDAFKREAPASWLGRNMWSLAAVLVAALAIGLTMLRRRSGA